LFKVSSYLLIPNYKMRKSKDIEHNPSKYFIDINEERIKEIVVDIDPYYIDGAIQILYYEHEIMGIKYSDLVDQLWAYFVNMIDVYHKNGRAETYFPDMPVKIEMVNLRNNTMKFVVQDHITILPEKEFIKELLEQSITFFTRLETLINGVNYSSEVHQAKKLLQQMI